MTEKHNILNVGQISSIRVQTFVADCLADSNRQKFPVKCVRQDTDKCRNISSKDRNQWRENTIDVNFSFESLERPLLSESLHCRES